MTQLDLESIASHLEGLEETIIYKLIDRAQFKVNAQIYEPGKSGFDNADVNESLFDLRIKYHEQMDSLFGRYHVPEERPFCTDLQSSQRAGFIEESGLFVDDYNCINITSEIKKEYFESIPLFCMEGDDKQYGSSVEHDVYALQALSRRIHYGAMYVAESKFRADQVLYNKHIENRDEEALLNLLTRKDVEDKILKRVKDKLTHAQSKTNGRVRRIINPDIILLFYREHIIPMTKKGEILYLLNRTSPNDN